jgi:hypothetical protein
MSENTSGSRAQLLDELRGERAQWEALLADIGEERMTQPGVAGEWSFKELVSHLTGWRRRTVGRFQAALSREGPPAPPWPAELTTDDEINAWFIAADRERSVADVLADDHVVFERLYDTLAAFTEDELHDPTRFPWLAEDGGDGLPPLRGVVYFDHYHEEHEPDVRAWVKEIGPRADS